MAKKKAARRWRGLSPIQRKVYDYIKVVESPSAIDQTALAEVRAMGEAGAQTYWTEKLEPSAREAAGIAQEFLRGNPKGWKAEANDHYVRADYLFKLAETEPPSQRVRYYVAAVGHASVSIAFTDNKKSREAHEIRQWATDTLVAVTEALESLCSKKGSTRKKKARGNPGTGRRALRNAMRGT